MRSARRSDGYASVARLASEPQPHARCDGALSGRASSANLYSLIETAKANRLEPGRYLAHLFEKLPAVTLPDHLDALLPSPTRCVSAGACAAGSEEAPASR